MSKNSQDEPDEYEIIFDGSKPDSVRQSESTIEVSDGDPVSVPEYIDAEVDETDEFMKNHQADADDGDIEEGIFAPVRKEKTASKKTAPLMWAVSLLAVVGVGAVVYVSNPDIVSKVTQNIGSGDGTILPNDVAADVPTDDQNAISEPTLQTTSDNSAAISPDPIVADAHHDDLQQDTNTDTTVAAADQAVVAAVPAPADTPVEAPPVETPASDAAVVAPTADLLTHDNTPAEQPAAVAATVEPAESTPNAVVAEPSPVATPDVAPIAMSAEPVVAPTAESSETIVATSDSDMTPTKMTSAPSSEIITPTNDRDDVEEAAENETSKQAAPIVAAPAAENAPVASAAVQSATTTNTPTVAAQAKAPVIVASKEEKKALDDANLDKYFDSPVGKMLKDIPAPSMDPKKGNNESIIVVNKKGQKTRTDYSKPAGKVTIEATSLNAQVVSANRALKLGRYDAAKEMYDELYRLNPRDGQILSGRAILLQKMGFADQAIAAYEELLQIYPDNADAIVNLSGLIRKQYPAVALSKLLDLHMKHPNNVAVIAQLGVAYADAGNYADAMRYLGDAAAMDPKNALHFYNMAVISDKAKKSEQAISYYEKALEVDTIYGEGQKTISREKIYDRLAQIRGN